MKIGKLVFITLSIVALNLAGTQYAMSQHKSKFSKNGEIHAEVINLWNTYYRDYFSSEIKRRLFQQGDVYVLYDVQIGGLQSFVEMTRRCKDTQQIAALVDMLSPVFSTLKPIPGADNSTGWICSGGSICTAYGFLGKEVSLCSVQFLGLIGALATTVSENIPPFQQTPSEKAFVAASFNTMAVQLNRWLSTAYFSSVKKRLFMVAPDLKEKNSGIFFSDKDLWYLTVLSDLSQLHQAGIQPIAEDGKQAFKELLKKKDGIQNIFDLFLARSFLTQTPRGMRAEIDKGFWKYFFDNRYATYKGSVSPVNWTKNSDGEFTMNTQVIWDSNYISQEVGWDISHARRLVPALETFVRNHENLKKVWGYDNQAFNPIALRKAYANQVVEKIWNGDINFPLFTNFYSGDNGWYRVAYANQTGRQFAGYPPFGMNASMPMGGYPIWGAFNPTLSNLFTNIYELSQQKDSTAKSFMKKYYPGLSVSKPGNTLKEIQNLSFLSDMVEHPVAKFDK